MFLRNTQPRSRGAFYAQRPTNSRNGRYGTWHRDRPGQAALMPANFTTLPHFSVSSAMSLPKSAGEPGSAAAPNPASRAFIWESEARIDLFVELLDDLCRRILGCAEAKPEAR